MANQPDRDVPQDPTRISTRPRQALTSDIPEELRGERFVTLTVGGNVDMAEMHPTEANPEARG